VIRGDDELAQGVAALKDMASGEQVTCRWIGWRLNSRRGPGRNVTA
jgi:histidyl-tRNA synthetase